MPTVTSTSTRYLLIIIQSFMLGSIVYYATSTIPSFPIDFNNKLIISAIVVVLYASLQYFTEFLSTIKTQVCAGTIVDTGSETDTTDTNESIPIPIPIPSDLIEEAIQLIGDEPGAAEEENGAKKTTGIDLLGEGKGLVPAETTESFVNYGAW